MKLVVVQLIRPSWRSFLDWVLTQSKGRITRRRQFTREWRESLTKARGKNVHAGRFMAPYILRPQEDRLVLGSMVLKVLWMECPIYSHGRLLLSWNDPERRSSSVISYLIVLGVCWYFLCAFDEQRQHTVHHTQQPVPLQL